MLIAIIKTLHVLSAVVFLGMGAGTAWVKLRGDRSGDPHVVAWTQRHVVQADWFFTIPSGVLSPLTGIALVELYGLPWSTTWVLVGTAGYVGAGLFWLPAAWLQLRMRADAEAALRDATPLPERFWRDHRAWLLLGIPSFSLAMLSVWAMVSKWA